MKLICLAIFATLSLLTATGQSIRKANTIYLELGGNALFTSLNYERQIANNTNVFIHVGAGIYGIQSTYLTIPFGIKYLFQLGNSTSFIDLGLGATYSKANVKLYAIVDRKEHYTHTNFWNYIPNVGYRKHTKNNLMYRFSLSPVINHNGILPFLGFTIGKSF